MRCIHLNKAEIISLVPVVSAPRLSLNIFDSKTLGIRQIDVSQCSLAAFIQSRLKNYFQFILGDSELLLQPDEPVIQIAFARKRFIQPLQDFVIKAEFLFRRDSPE